MTVRSRILFGLVIPLFSVTALFACKNPAADDDDASVGSDQVEILRDTWGIPHVYADTMQGVMFGFAYAQAEDHLDSMLVHYLASDGKTSSVFEGGDPALSTAGYSGDPAEIDRMAHLFRTRAAIDEAWDEINDGDLPDWDASTTELLTAFAAGVNAYMVGHPAKVPTWWQGDVEPQSVAAWLRRFLLTYQQAVIQAKLAGRDAPDPQESNEWVVAPQRTSDGSVYLQSDPHLPFSGVTRWYEAHLTGGGLDVAGATLFGMPMIAMGHNRTLAFTETSNGMDNADVFQVEVVDSDHYRYGNDELPFVVKDVTLPLAGGGTQTLSLAWTHQGPVIQPLDTTDFTGINTVLVAGMTMFEQVHSFAQFLALGWAGTVQEWRDVMQPLQLQRWNFVVGDSEGSIFYVSNSRHPDRTVGPDWSAPVDGSDPALDWTVIEPWAFDDLAWGLDPAAGFFQNCNNSPGWVTPTYSDPIDEANFPDHYFPHNASTVRGIRALQQLDSRTDWTFEALQELSMDVHSMAAEWYVPALNAAYQAYGGSAADPEALAIAVGLLDGWDYRATTDSTAMTLFETWLIVAGDEVDAGSPPPDPVDPAVAIAALDAMALAVRTLETRYGTAAVPWGDIHRIRRGDVDLPIAGSGVQTQMLFMATPTVEEDGVGYAGRGSSYMLLTRFAPDGSVEAVSVKPNGNSEDPDSPHYADLTAKFAANEYKPFWYERADVEANLESTTEIEYQH